MGVKPRAALLGILTALALQQCLCIRPKIGNREDKVIGWSEKCVQECPAILYRHYESWPEHFFDNSIYVLADTKTQTGHHRFT